MQVDNAGGWKLNTKLDVKAHLALLGTKGVKVTADVTAFAADMTTTWMQVGMVVNAQNNNDNGANNNLGWNDLGSQDVVRDGKPHTYTWVLSDALTAKIAVADSTIGWFELALISNLDGARRPSSTSTTSKSSAFRRLSSPRAATPSSATGSRRWTAGWPAAAPTPATATPTA